MLVEGQEDTDARHSAPEGPSGGLSGNQSPGIILPCTPSWGGRSGGSQGPENEGTGKGSVLGLDPAVRSGPQGGWASHWILAIMLDSTNPLLSQHCPQPAVCPWAGPLLFQGLRGRPMNEAGRRGAVEDSHSCSARDSVIPCPYASPIPGADSSMS